MNRIIKFLSAFDLSHSTYKYASTTAHVFASRRFNFLFTPWNRRVKIICDASLVDIDGENLIIKIKETK